MNAPLARALTADLAQCKLVKQGRLMLGSGPFVILRSASDGILGVCELPLDGGFIPREFRIYRGMIIPGAAITKRGFRYSQFRNLDAWWAIHHLWEEESVAIYGPPLGLGSNTKAPSRPSPSGH